MSASTPGRLGPFSGTQLTVIIVTVAVLLLFPAGAWAVAGSNVFVTDSGTGSHAFVSGAGQLNVTRAGAKSYRISHFVSDVETTSVPIKPPAGKAFVVTSIFVNVVPPLVPADDSGLILDSEKGRDDCTTGFQEVLGVNPSAAGLITIPFDPGIVIPAHRALCVHPLDITKCKFVLWAYGYTIPASAAPTEPPVASS